MKGPINLLRRRASRFVEKSILPTPDKTIISFSFDDCPLTVVENALPMLEAEDWRATIYVACGLCETTNHLGLHMSLGDINDAHNRGHEIAGHTYSHLNGLSVKPEVFLADIDRNQDTLKSLGLPASRHFAYPFGEVSPTLKRALSSKFETLRGVISPKSPTQDANLLNGMRIYSGDTIEAAITQLNASIKTPQWLHFFTHDVRENPSIYGCTPGDFRRVVDAVKSSGASVMTVDQAHTHLQKKKSIQT